MPERNRFRPSVMSPQVLARGHRLPRNVRRRFRDQLNTGAGDDADRGRSLAQHRCSSDWARKNLRSPRCPPGTARSCRIRNWCRRGRRGRTKEPSACAGMLVREAAASAAAARMIVRIKSLLGKRTIRQAYCNGLASDVIANTPVRSIRGDAREPCRWSGPKKTSRAEALLPRRTWMKRNFCFRARRLRLCADLSSQDLDRVADGAGDCLALRPHAI